MSDLEAVRRMLDRAGVVYVVAWEEGKRTLTVTAKDGPKNTGYADFVSVLVFDSAGALTEWGAWE